MMQIVAQQSVQFRQLHEALANASRLSDRIAALSQELERESDRMSHEFRSVEVLEEILAQHVFGKSQSGADTATNPSPQGSRSMSPGEGREARGEGRRTSVLPASTGTSPVSHHTGPALGTSGPVMF